jgi:hypothetical protein
MADLPNAESVHQNVREVISEWLPGYYSDELIQSRVRCVGSNILYDTFEYETPPGSGDKKMFLVTVSVVEIDPSAHTRTSRRKGVLF